MRKIEITVFTVGYRYEGMYFHSLTSASRALHLQKSHISEVLSGKRRQHKGYTFKKIERRESL